MCAVAAAVGVAGADRSSVTTGFRPPTSGVTRMSDVLMAALPAALSQGRPAPRLAGQQGLVEAAVGRLSTPNDWSARLTSVAFC